MTNDENVVLKPCPFCGSTVLSVSQNSIECSAGCGAQMISEDDDICPIDTWNTRSAQSLGREQAVREAFEAMTLIERLTHLGLEGSVYDEVHSIAAAYLSTLSPDNENG